METFKIQVAKSELFTDDAAYYQKEEVLHTYSFESKKEALKAFKALCKEYNCNMKIYGIAYNYDGIEIRKLF